MKYIVTRIKFNNFNKIIEQYGFLDDFRLNLLVFRY